MLDVTFPNFCSGVLYWENGPFIPLSTGRIGQQIFALGCRDNEAVWILS